MTNPSTLEHLYFPQGPLVNEALKERLRLHRKRFRLVLGVSSTSILHLILFFAVAWLLRSLEVENPLRAIVLATVAAIVCSSMLASIVPALIEHWRFESNAPLVQGKRSLIIQTPLETPPLNAELLFYMFMRPHESEALIGDLDERYKLIRTKWGRLRANVWYWSQTLRSLGSILLWAAKGALKSLLFFEAVLELLNRIRS